MHLSAYMYYLMYEENFLKKWKQSSKEIGVEIVVLKLKLQLGK